jgi:hypothetical protein
LGWISATPPTFFFFHLFLVRRHRRLFFVQGLVVGLEARHNAEIGLAVGAVVLGLPAQDPTVGVRRVPAVVASQGRAVTGFGAVPELLDGKAPHDGERAEVDFWKPFGPKFKNKT